MGLFSKSRGYKEGQVMRDNPVILKQLMAEQDARQMKGVLAEAFGSAAQAAVPEQTAAYQMGGDEMMEGERPIQGLMNITQEARPAQAGSGLLGSAGSPEESRYLQAMKALSSQGGVGGTQQANKMLSAMQNSVMQDSGSMARQVQGQQAKLDNPQLGRAETGLEFYQRAPGEHRQWQNQRNVPKTSINNTWGEKNRNLKDEVQYETDKADQLAIAKDRRTYLGGIVNQGRSARQDMIKTDRMLSLLDSGVKTGFGQDWILQARQAGKSLLGIDTETMGPEELQVLMGDLVMKRVSETKGAVSEREMKLFQEYSANFGKSPEGNKAILNFYKSMLERSKAMSGKIRAWRKEGMSEYDIEEKILKYQDDNALTIGKPRKAIKDMTLEEKKARLKELRSRM